MWGADVITQGQPSLEVFKIGYDGTNRETVGKEERVETD